MKGVRRSMVEPVTLITIIEEACQKDPAATEFATAILEWFHILDDLVDGDVKWSAEQVALYNLRAMSVFSMNPFFQQHRDRLMAVIQQSASAWLDSMRTETVKPTEAVVLKAQYQDVLWETATIVGGWQHMRRCSIKWRTYETP